MAVQTDRFISQQLDFLKFSSIFSQNLCSEGNPRRGQSLEPFSLSLCNPGKVETVGNYSVLHRIR